MKKNLTIGIAAIILTAGIYGCDKVKEGNYYKPVSTSTSETKVLIEDFTGHTCGNCPRAHETAAQLKETYGENVIVMGIHVGFFAKTGHAPYDYEFRTPEGNALDSLFKISDAGLPQGMVNRKEFSGSRIVAYGAWGQHIATLLKSEPSVLIQKDSIIATYNAAKKTVDVRLETKFVKTLTGKYNLVVCLTEDSIIKPQKDYSKNPQTIDQYAHRHVLRTTADGTLLGETIATKVIVGEPIRRKYSINIKDDWNTKQLAIVTFVTDAITNQVLQVQEQHVH